MSVNKLKEGWDVKNIAVVVTLRAMASEVLTQQTMGRGLRLPFGTYTDVWQIDQLDIIAHQSFSELLATENVLQQFGLEKAVADTRHSRVKEAIRQAATGDGNTHGDGENGGQCSSDTSAVTGTCDTHGAVSVDNHVDEENTPGVRVREIDSSEVDVDEPVTMVIERNPAFQDETYLFPVTYIELKQSQVNLFEISDDQIRQAATRVTSANDVLMRKEIVAVLGQKLRTEDRESVEIDSIHIDNDTACNALIKLVMNMPQVPKKPNSAYYVSKTLVPKFMKSVDCQEGWTVKTLESARHELDDLIRTYIDKVLSDDTHEEPSIHPTVMPRNSYPLRLGEQVYDQIDTRDEFVRGRVYRGWFKSLFTEEFFDSYTGEYQLARLLNTSPGITWWHRLHPQDRAFIYYTAQDRYFPDFVARDTDGVSWIIEAKAENGRNDATVQKKRKAAETLVRSLAAEDNYRDQQWGYLIAYEHDIAQADSWDDLKTFSRPVSNIL